MLQNVTSNLEHRTSPMFHAATPVLFNRQIAQKTFLLRLAAPALARSIRPGQFLMLRLLATLQTDDPADATLVPRWLEALDHPFALRVNEAARDRTRLRLAALLGPKHPACTKVFESFEPYPNWSEDLLVFRAACYDEQRSPARDQAAQDLLKWRAETPVTLEQLLAP